MSDPTIVELTPRPFAYISLHSTLPEMPATMGEGFATLAKLFAQAKAQMAGNPLTHYTEFDEKSVSFDLGFPVHAEDIPALRTAGLSIGETPGGRNMTATNIGPYDTVSRTYDLMAAAMKQQGLTGTEDMWESYLSPPDTPANEIRTDVIWRVEEAG